MIKGRPDEKKPGTWTAETEELLLDSVMKNKAHSFEHGKVTEIFSI